MWHWYEQYNLINIILKAAIFIRKEEERPLNRYGQKNHNGRTEPSESNRNIRSRNQTQILKYRNGSYIYIFEITKPS